MAQFLADELQTCESTLPGDVMSACAARALVRRELAAWNAGDLVDDCSLIVSELVSNAIRHGGSALTLRLSTNGGWVYGEVFDEGEEMPRLTDADLDATDGRGLLIVAGLADEWGVASLPDGGKIVWFIVGG